MTVTNPSSYTRDTAPWVHGTFVVSLGDDGTGRPVDYRTYAQIVQNNSRDEQFGSVASPGVDPNVQTVLNGADQTNGPLPVYFTHSKCRDTTLGGNDAINCYYQYNETDDPPHPFTKSETTLSTGEGRVYSETIDDHQQILYITFGLPKFNNLAGFYQAALDKDIAELVNSGGTTNLMSKLTAMAGATITTLVNLPSLPVIWIQSLLTKTIQQPITKYYDFSNQMGLYYKYVQTILTHIGVNMGFFNDGHLLGLNPTVKGLDVIANVINDVVPDQTSAVAQSADQGTPDIFRQFHMDVYQILQRRAAFLQTTGLGAGPTKVMSTDKLVEQMAIATNASIKADSGQYNIADLNPLQSAAAGFLGTVYNALLYVGFRVEKSTDASESISNQIGPSEIAGFINSKSQAAREAKFKAMYGRTGIGALDWIGDMLGSAANYTEQKIDNSKGVEGLTALATGSGMIDIPEVWKDSSLTKSYSFDLRLRAPYGDPITIIQTLYTPLAMLLAAAMPRATGNSSYATPFICRAYCKGMFAVPLGMIESMTIKRGSDTNGWTYQRLPTAIDINFTIKDLSPCMYMAMADLSGITGDNPLLPPVPGSTSWNAAFGNNSSFQEYMLTLSGMGLAERSLQVLQMKRKVQLLMQTSVDFKLNPFYWGMEAGGSMPARFISAIIPITKLPQN